jgi:hypothetical protein
MSRLILQGELQRNFGDYYPIPYIDKVQITSKGDQDIKLRIDYSFLFTMPESDKSKVDIHMQQLYQTLEKFHFYLYLTRPPSYIGAQAEVIERIKNGGTPRPPSVILGRKREDTLHLTNPFSQLEALTHDSSQLIDIIRNSGADQDSIFIDLDETVILKKIREKQYLDFTTDGSNRIVKVSSTVDQIVPIMGRPLPGETGRMGCARDMVLFGFSSLYSLDVLKKLSGKLSTSRAYSLYFSDIAYERILVSDGNVMSPTLKVPDQIQTFFFDDQGEMYSGMPLQSIDGTYHKADPALRNEIADKVGLQIDSYIPQLAADTQGVLHDSMNSIRYAVNDQSDISALLPEINKARKVIPERSTGTMTGKFYEDIGTSLFRANAIVRRSPQIQKQLVVNSKIIDNRARDRDYELPDPKVVSSQLVPAEDLLKNFFMDRKVVTTNQPSTRISFADYDVAADTRWESYIDGLGADEMESYDDDEFLMLQLPNGDVWSWDDPEAEGLLNDNYFANEEYNVSFGYFFFDYDTAIRKNSYIANIFNVDRVIRFFGLPWLQGFFQPTEVYLNKYAPQNIPMPNSRGAIMTFRTPLSFVDSKNPRGTSEYNPGGSDASGHGEIVRHGKSIDDGAPHQTYPEKIQLNRGKGHQRPIIINSYLAQRSFNMVNDELLRGPSVSLTRLYGNMIDEGYVSNAYRLMAFEFQNIDQMATLDDYEDKVSDKYVVGIQLVDATRQAVLAIIQNFANNMKNYKEEYVRLAQQFCSYNNIDSHFNDFFKSAMRQRYSEDPSSAPWIYAISMYVKHMEFLTNRYGGNEADQLVDAKELLQRIQPETGTLEHVEAFMNVLEETFENFYGPSSQIGKFLIGDGKDFDGGANKTYAPITYNLKYWTTHRSFIRSAFVMDDRNEFLSLINEEREKYVNAEEEYEKAIARSQLPPVEKIPDPAFEGGCPATDMRCNNEFGAPGGPMSPLPGAKKCSGKKVVVAAGHSYCMCPSGTYEDDDGKCQTEGAKSQKEAKAAGKSMFEKLGAQAKEEKTTAAEEKAGISSVTDSQATYEANKMKKRSPKKKKDKHDCQYVKYRNSKSAYYWKSPKGTNNWESKYDKSKYGNPSYWSYVKRRIKCKGSGKKKKCHCEYKAYSGGWTKDPSSLSSLKSKIKAKGRIGDAGTKFKFIGDT